MHPAAAFLEGLFASGRIADIALVLMMAGTVTVWLYRRSASRPIPFADLAWNALAGAGLLLALRVALTGAGWPWVAGFLTLSLIGYVGDLRRRLAAR